MDALAKKYWAEKFGNPPQGPTAGQQEVEGEPISVYINGKKVATKFREKIYDLVHGCLLYTSPSPRDLSTSRMPSSA